eukprot:Hpha_TRINITY_DN11074_c0_g1::TRINITY_DN11074_c0_g1_i1::g.92668::m.92668/K07918/RAB32; Ras-related protein Rab-32
MEAEQGLQLLKVLVVGEVGVGKTTLVHRFVHRKFSGSLKPTIGVDFALKEAVRQGGEKVMVQVWDVAGQERVRQLTRVYYQGARGVVVVFDLTRRDTLRKALEWKKDIDNKVLLPDESPVPCLLVGSKLDLVSKAPATAPSDSEIEEMYTEGGFRGCIKTSSRQGTGVEDAFTQLVHLAAPPAAAPATDARPTSVRLEPSAAPPARRACAC